MTIKTALAVLYLLTFGLSPVAAEECTTTYGGGVVCPTPEPEVEVVHEAEELPDTGLVSDMVLATAIFGGGYALLMAAQKFAKLGAK